MDRISETEKALETVLLQNGRDMFGIYQLKPGDELRYHRWVSYATLRSEGNDVKRENYTLVYTGNLEKGQTLDNIYERFNLELPADFRGHPLSISDIIVIQRNGTVTAHYVNKGFGFIPIPGFIAGYGLFDNYFPKNSIDVVWSMDDDAFYMVSNQEAAILKAHELMAEYGIDTITAEDPKITYSKEFCKHRGNREFRKMLASVIAPNFRCKCFDQGGQVVFFGRTGDAKIAKEVFEYAYSFAYKESNRLAAQIRSKGYRSEGIINSYALGFIQGLSEKLGEQSNALMVIVPPDVNDKYDEMTKGWKKSKSRLNIVSGSGGSMAYNRGLADGRTVMNGRKLKSAG